MPLPVEQLVALIENHAASLRLWVRSRTSSCDDVVQEAFCRLFIEEPPPDRPVAWLYRVSRNLAEKQRRSDGRRRRREELCARTEFLQADPAESLEQTEALAHVESLDAELRDVLISRIWGELSFEEVGALCGISAATACRRYHAALVALKIRLETPCKKCP